MDASRTDDVTLKTGRPRRRLLPAVLAVLVLALAGSAGYVAWEQHDRVQALRDDSAEDAAAVEAARELALAWTTVDYKEPDAYFESIRNGAGGDFLSELEDTEDDLKRLLVANESVQTASIPTDGAALVERTGDDATVLVTVDTTVRTKREPEPTPRQYRLRLTLHREASAWLTTGLEFVG